MTAVTRRDADDVVYDLGCGDGRIVIAAAKLGARAVCVDIDPLRIADAQENARGAGVAERIEFRNDDLFDVDLAAATVMLFLSPNSTSSCARLEALARRASSRTGTAWGTGSRRRSSACRAASRAPGLSVGDRRSRG